jgi:uncharacterized surface protein with fasciclin (FAS1) repeats
MISVKINESTVTMVDVEASNGVIHVIDSVLLPPGLVLPEVPSVPSTTLDLDIVDTAIASDFNTLVAAVTAAGLVDTLRGDGPFTVFAPTDEAFAALPEGILDALLLPENLSILQDILLYHVVAGSVLAAELMDGQQIEMANEDLVLVTIVEDMALSTSSVKINQSTVTVADVMASNGVIHVIDSVLLPPVLPFVDPTPSPVAPAPTPSPVASAASSAKEPKKGKRRRR